MNNKKSLISKLLIGGGLLALICGIFCFFGSAIKISGDAGGELGTVSISFSNMFSFMFGTNATMHISPSVIEEIMIQYEIPLTGPVNSVGGTTALFVIEMIIIVLSVILLVGVFAKKLQKKHITVGCGIVCVLALVSVILAFCSKEMLKDAATLPEGMEQFVDFSLGSAGISYGVLGIVGILATGAGLFLGKDEAVAA